MALTAGLFHGVYAMDPAFPDVVGASANVGRLSTEDGQIQVCAFLRSARPSWEAELARAHDALAGTLGFSAEASGYPGWTGDPANPLAAVLARVYREQTGQEAELLSIGGGTYAKACPNLVAFGPLFPGQEMTEHQPDEYMEADTLLKNAQMMAAAIWELAR